MAPLIPALAGLAAILLPYAAAQCQDTEPQNGNPSMASGYQSKVLTSGLNDPRHIALDTEGNLLVALRGGSGIQRIVLEDNGGIDVCVESSDLLIDNDQLNHGIAVSPTGKTVFASTATDVYEYEYDPVAGTVGEPKHLITGMEQGGSHHTRTLVVPSSDPNILIVSRGSEDNLDMETLDPSTGRSIIKYWSIDEFTGDPVQFSSTGTVLGMGLRNSVGVGEDPTSGGIWSVENSVDNMARLGDDIHNDNPGEELNYHGLINSTEPNEQEGKNYGYPICYAVWETSTVTGVDDVRVGMQITGGEPTEEHTDEWCASDTEEPRLTFPAHTAPLDVKFLNDGSAAFISFHGSWNRSPPDGYRLSRIDFADGQPMEPANSRDAEIPIMWNSNNGECPNSCFRPCGLAIDSENRIFMSSDATGEIFLVVETEDSGGGYTMNVSYASILGAITLYIILFAWD